MADVTNQHSHTLINTFTPVEGGMEALVAFQLAEMHDMSTEAGSFGWLGNEVFGVDDGSGLMVVTRFRSVEAKQRWAQSARFQRHLEAIEPLIDNVRSVPVSFIAAHGPAGRIR